MPDVLSKREFIWLINLIVKKHHVLGNHPAFDFFHWWDKHLSCNGFSLMKSYNSFFPQGGQDPIPTTQTTMAMDRPAPTGTTLWSWGPRPTVRAICRLLAQGLFTGNTGWTTQPMSSTLPSWVWVSRTCYTWHSILQVQYILSWNFKFYSLFYFLLC